MLEITLIIIRVLTANLVVNIKHISRWYSIKFCLFLWEWFKKYEKNASTHRLNWAEFTVERTLKNTLYIDNHELRNCMLWLKKAKKGFRTANICYTCDITYEKNDAFAKHYCDSTR